MSFSLCTNRRKTWTSLPFSIDTTIGEEWSKRPSLVARRLLTLTIADHILTMQDGEMRKKGLSRHYIYDGLGRISSQTFYQGNAIHGIEQRNYYDGDYSLISDNGNTLAAEARNMLAYSGVMGVTSWSMTTLDIQRLFTSRKEAASNMYIPQMERS